MALRSGNRVVGVLDLPYKLIIFPERSREVKSKSKRHYCLAVCVMSSEGFTLRDIGLVLTRLPTGTSPKRLGEAIRRDSYALVNYNRVKMMLERLDCSDVLRLLDKTPCGQHYTTSIWIRDGILPDGGTDPLYRIRSVVTQKNHLTTLVLLSNAR